MFKVNIYMETDTGSRKRLYRGYGAVVEFIRKNGEPETREAFGLCDGTWNLAYILALTDALELLTRPVRLQCLLQTGTSAKACAMAGSGNGRQQGGRPSGMIR